jgi:hypothetical protein
MDEHATDRLMPGEQLRAGAAELGDAALAEALQAALPREALPEGFVERTMARVAAERVVAARTAEALRVPPRLGWRAFWLDAVVAAGGAAAAAALLLSPAALGPRSALAPVAALGGDHAAWLVVALLAAAGAGAIGLGAWIAAPAAPRAR